MMSSKTTLNIFALIKGFVFYMVMRSNFEGYKLKSRYPPTANDNVKYIKHGEISHGVLKERECVVM